MNYDAPKTKIYRNFFAYPYLELDFKYFCYICIHNYTKNSYCHVEIRQDLKWLNDNYGLFFMFSGEVDPFKIWMTNLLFFYILNDKFVLLTYIT